MVLRSMPCTASVRLSLSLPYPSAFPVRGSSPRPSSPSQPRSSRICIPAGLSSRDPLPGQGRLNLVEGEIGLGDRTSGGKRLAGLQEPGHRLILDSSFCSFLADPVIVGVKGAEQFRSCAHQAAIGAPPVIFIEQSWSSEMSTISVSWSPPTIQGLRRGRGTCPSWLRAYGRGKRSSRP